MQLNKCRLGYTWLQQYFLGLALPFIACDLLTWQETTGSGENSNGRFVHEYVAELLHLTPVGGSLVDQLF
jgi:hypothetical protein